MKKLLSIVLALCMVAGIGVCGTIGASASLGDLITGGIIADGLFTKLSYIAQLTAYGTCEMKSLQPVFEAGLLSDKNMDDVVAAVKSASAAINADIEKFLVYTTPADIEQAAMLCNKTFAENFSSDFLAEFNAFKGAYTQAMDQYLQALPKLFKTLEMLENGSIFLLEPNLLFEVLELIDGPVPLDFPTDATSFADLTAYYMAITERIKTTIVKLDAYSAQAWWQRLPTFVQWLLRYLCFGWIWMK